MIKDSQNVSDFLVAAKSENSPQPETTCFLLKRKSLQGGLALASTFKQNGSARTSPLFITRAATL